MQKDSHRDVNELDEVANEAHDSKAHSDSLTDLNKFYHKDWRPPLCGVAVQHVPFCEGFVQRVRNCNMHRR